ncbi:DUF58 domain-containing protein [Empedobacter brevis]|uniref:DUF58 domain-containing protein n=2 Tax=Empedobacter brevis TaxID=247 RepID=A0AAJ1QH43_9FLAO|nr:DUF58 domain-containing protein [Empedobacter brevis]MDM1073975.1 DUF58 domain-containing protein [Empedobacter brevis]QHC84680.1 cell division protein FtsB [Empedobacter brevis]
MKFFKSLFLTDRFFYAGLFVAFCFVIGFFMPPIFIVAKIVVLAFILAVLIEIFLVYIPKNSIEVIRIYPERLSNGDDNEMKIAVSNQYQFPLNVRILEEFPVQLQLRDFQFKKRFKSGQNIKFNYQIRPTERGLYTFGQTNVFISVFGFIEKRIKINEPTSIACYPSYLQLKQLQLHSAAQLQNQFGMKRIRKIGTNTEFENIKHYTIGDEYRLINWKATAKANRLMVNQFQEEKSQPVYSLIDLGRTMRMPFDGLKLLDYSINSSLVVANISLQKNEKAGLITFNKKIQDHVVADRKNHQMQLILEKLYNVQTDYLESDYGQLYAYIKRKLTQRSLLFIYTNFETIDGLERQLPYLKLIKKSHVVVLILFKNSALKKLNEQKAKTTTDIYDQTIAEKFNYDKELIINRLHQFGILTIYCEPKELSIHLINKYLEIKARGLF